MSDMPKIPYLVKRGHVFWWRRRKPVFMSRQPSHDIEKTRMQADGGTSRGAGHFAFSLRTTCPKEAGRRSAQMNLVFEEKRRRVEAVMSRDDGMTDQSYLGSTPVETAGAPGGPEPGNARPRRPRRGSGGRRFSEHARRFLDLRSEGFDLNQCALRSRREREERSPGGSTIPR
jgi:hypothetical protein